MPITPRKLKKILEKEGFISSCQTGSHLIMNNTRIQKKVVIPMHSKDIPKGTLNSILKDSGLKGQIKI